MPLPDKIDDAQIVAHTEKWITEVVVGCHFCPFAAREIKRKSILYEVLHESDKWAVWDRLKQLCNLLDEDTKVETVFLILPYQYELFYSYLRMAEAAERQLYKQGYEGIYQLASFHPAYLFAGSREEDAENFTNRSPYPMLHILREESVERAIASYPDTADIPDKNIAFARAKGLAYMKQLWEASFII